MLLPVGLFILGVAFLIKGGDWFVDGAVDIARKFNMPELLIGATIVSIGTTLPEVLVSAQAAFQGNSGIAYGNSIGSIICNTSLIAAILIAVMPSKIERKSLIIPTFFFFAIASFYASTAYLHNEFTRKSGIVLLLCFLGYLIVTIQSALKDKSNKRIPIKKPKNAELMLLAGAILIAFGANLVVDNGTIIAKLFGVPDAVIGLTVVALGTSLPEMITAITSLIKKHNSLSIGNVIGANIINLALVSGTAITIAPFQLPANKLINNMNSSLVIDIPLMMFVMLLLCTPIILKGKTYRWQGILLLCCYVGFSTYQLT